MSSADRITELEAALAERDATIAAARRVRTAHRNDRIDEQIKNLDAILFAAPGDALTAHDAEVKAQALEEAAERYREGQLTGVFYGRNDYTKAWLCDRAKAIREEGNK